MNLNKYSIACIFALMLMIFAGGCGSSQSNNGQVPVITELTAEHPDVYPLGNTRITCNATDPNGDPLTYSWTCNDGRILGEGSTITWEGPKTYGDFYVMVTVTDIAGNTATKTATVTVIVRDPTKCCR